MPTEGLVIDSTAEDAGNVPLDLFAYPFVVTANRTPTPPLQPRWAEPADADGERLVASRYQNREIAVSLEIVPAEATSDARAATAEAALGTLSEKLAKLNREAGTLRRTMPSGSVLTFDLLTADQLDPSWDVGWETARAFSLDLRFTAKPFWRGTEVAGPSVSGTTPVLTLDVPSVPGDARAEGRLVITEGSAQSRRFIEWGLEQRYYDARTPAPLLIDSEDLVTSGFAGAQATRTGAYQRAGARNGTIAATLFSQPVAVCGTGNLPHVGVFRVKARVWASSTAVKARLNWQDGDGPLSPNDYASPPAAGTFCELDLGLVTIQLALAGTQRWTGRIEAYSTTSGDTIEIDYLTLIPAGEGYGKVRARYVEQPGVISGHDEFSGTAGTALNGRVAPSGGSWATSGAATDYTITTNAVQRATTADSGVGRLAILGSVVSADMSVSVLSTHMLAGTSVFNWGVIARYVDPSNYLVARLDSFGSFVLGIYIAGSPTALGSAVVPVAALTYTMSIVTYSSGRVIARVYDYFAPGSPLATIDKSSSILATGGTLATGKPGFLDFGGTSAPLRFFSDFLWGVPAAERIALYAGRTLEVRSNDTIRQDSSGTYYGPPQSYEGDRLYVPPAGGEGRTSRILVKAHRNDLDVAEHVPLGDSITAQLYYTPRFLAAPN